MTSSSHIIVVEDEETLRYLLETLLKTLYPTARVSLVESSTAALQIYDQFGADLLITDKHLPLNDGIELTRTLRTGGATLPIIVISGDSLAEQGAIEAGATLFLKKPGAIRELRTLLPTLLPP